MTARETAQLRLRRTAAALLSPADVERIAARAESWADDERVRRLVSRLGALVGAHAVPSVRVPYDWRECAPSPNCDGDT